MAKELTYSLLILAAARSGRDLYDESDTVAVVAQICSWNNRKSALSLTGEGETSIAGRKLVVELVVVRGFINQYRQ